MSESAPSRPHPTPAPDHRADPAYELWRLWQQGQRPDVRDFLAAHPDLPLTRCVGVLRVDQQERWLRGERVRAEEYLDSCFFLHGSGEHALDVVYGEFLLRERLGEAPVLDEYAERFPQFAAQLRRQVELHRALASDMRFCSTAEASAEFAERPTVVRHRDGAPLPDVPGYEVLGLLGRGGMGVVYRARQLKPRRVVALKMLRGADAADSELLARFRAESEALARLQHPNIVQVYEVGEHSGRPYVALEYVEGGSLHQQTAGAPQPAGPAAQYVQRLARAVHYAHERGIVHRDLKPHNVLLAADGTPKVTDFGLAKLLAVELGPSSLDYRTQSGAIVGTPSYMAPEQTGGRAAAVGPAADVYALGAILYELLTGRPPLQGASVLETLEQVRTQEPVPVRRLQPKVPKDLETICLKCLRKEPAQRYTAAAELADDLGRFLAGRPIQARATARWERCWKWARRRPAVAGLALALAVAVLGLLGLGAWSYLEIRAALADAKAGRQAAQQAAARESAERRQADVNRRDAERHKERAERNGAEARRKARDASKRLGVAFRAINKYLTYISEDVLLAQPRMEGLRAQLLKYAVGLYEQLLHDASDDPQIQAQLARAHFRFGQLLMQTEQRARASESYGKGLALVEKLAECKPAEPTTRFHLAEALVFAGRHHSQAHELARAEAAYRRAIRLLTDLLAASPKAAEYQNALAWAHSEFGELYLQSDRVNEALTEYRAAHALARKLVERQPADEGHRILLARIQAWLARTLIAAGRLDEAEAPSRAALPVLRQAARDRPKSPDYQTHYGTALHYRATLDYSMRRPEEARKGFDEAMSVFERLAREHPAVSAHQIHLGATYEALGALHVERQELGRARPLYQKALDIFGALEKAAPTTPRYLADLAGCCYSMARLEVNCADYEAALRWSEQGIGKAQLALAKGARNLQAREHLWRLLVQKAVALSQLGRHAEALTVLERAADLAGPSRREELMAHATELRARLGQHVRATAESEAAVAAGGNDGATATPLRGRAAAIHSLCSAFAAKDPALPADKRTALAETYQRRAMELLRQAHPGLHAHPLYLEMLRTGSDFDPLRPRPDFRAFLAKMEREAKRAR